jgi:hypothetical protein
LRASRARAIAAFAKIDLGLKTAGFVLERRERFLAAPPHRSRPDPYSGLPESTERDLRIFLHVTARQDRVLIQERATALAHGIGWPLAGVEFVDIRWTRPEGEIRSYFPGSVPVGGVRAAR